MFSFGFGESLWSDNKTTIQTGRVVENKNVCYLCTNERSGVARSVRLRAAVCSTRLLSNLVATLLCYCKQLKTKRLSSCHNINFTYAYYRCVVYRYYDKSSWNIEIKVIHIHVYNRKHCFLFDNLFINYIIYLYTRIILCYK